jgi:diaminopimelate epimerase
MCGNGARCVARLAVDIGAAPETLTFDTAAGLISARVLGDKVRLHMTTPTDWRLGKKLMSDDREIAYDYVNTGVPHCVVVCNAVAEVDLAKLGPRLRYHTEFAPKGTNVDFIAATGPSRIAIRTYERGVEDETLACGTGIVAGALIAFLSSKTTPPIQVTCASGDVLEVNFTTKNDGMPTDITLLGPTAYVFRGEVDYGEV